MKTGFFLSILGHAAILLYLVVGTVDFFRQSADDFQMVPVEILEIGDETNITAAALKAAEEPKPEPVKEEVRYANEAPPPPPAMNEPVAEDAMPPLEKARETKPEPQKAEPAPVRTSLPRRKPKTPAPEPKKSDKLDLAELQALLDKEPKEEPKPQPKQQEDALDSLDEFLAEETEERPRQKVGLGTGLTISQIDALKQEMQKCWRPPLGAANPEDYPVTVKVYMREDGTLIRAPEVVSSGNGTFGGGSFKQAFERAALAAVNKCAPYDFLPADKYDLWKEVTITFDPASMIGY